MYTSIKPDVPFIHTRTLKYPKDVGRCNVHCFVLEITQYINQRHLIEQFYSDVVIRFIEQI